MCGSENWPNSATERRLLSCLLDKCESSQFKPGKSWFVPVLLFLIHLAMTSVHRFSRLVIVLQFVFILCSKLRWILTSKWVKFVPKSWWIDFLTVRQRQKLIENKDFRPCCDERMKWTDIFSTARQNLKWKHNCSWILLLKMASGNVRKVMTLTQSESVGNTVKTIHDCFRHIFRQNDSEISLSANQRAQEWQTKDNTS